MHGDGVLIILTNYSRPTNMPAVIRAWREQSVPCKIVVVDNAPYTKVTLADGPFGDPIECEEYPKSCTDGADDVWRWTHNSGCPCWLAPALMLYGHKYVLRADDDFLPGRRAVENLLECAGSLSDKFSTLGQVGRKLSFVLFKDYYGYDRRNVPRNMWPVKVDLTCRVSFMLAPVVGGAIALRNLLIAEHPKESEKLVGVHDDFLISCGAQLVSNHPSYIVGTSDDPERELIKDEIPNGPESCYKRPNHYEERAAMARLVGAVGWHSLCT